MEQTAASTVDAPQPLGSGDLVELVVEVCEEPRIGEQLLRTLRHHVHHHRPDESLHHDLGPARPDLVHPRHGEAMFGGVLDDARFVLDDAAVFRPAQHQSRPVLVDVPVVSGREERPHFSHVASLT